MGWLRRRYERFIEDVSIEQIKKLAYSYYEERHYQQGEPDGDWNRARQEVVNASLWDLLFIFGYAIAFVLLYRFFFPHLAIPTVIFWGFIYFIVLITLHTSAKRVVFERLFRFLRACFLSLLAAIPVFTFSFQYWPELNIVRVENVRPYSLRGENLKGDNVTHLPNTAAILIKNASSAVVRDAEIRYWLVMRSDKQACTLAHSASNEKFSFGPGEEKYFEFNLGPLKDKELEKVHVDVIHLVAQVRYRPFLFPFKAEKRWEVFYYSNAEGHWVVQRKQASGWQNSFDDWYHQLDQAAPFSAPSLPICSLMEKPDLKVSRPKELE